MASTSRNEHGGSNVFDNVYNCFRVNGVLDPMPLSYYIPPPPSPSPPPPSPPPPPPPPPSYGATSFTWQPRSEQEEYLRGRRRRNLTASRILDVRTFTFYLFRCHATGENILAMHEIGTANTVYFLLVPHVTRGRIKLDAKEINLGPRIISRVLENVYPELDNRSDLSVGERLEGKWSIELRQRNGSMKTERFYMHEKIDRTFRSMSDVATFILLNVVY